ncbi:kinesin-like protein KIF15 [Sarcophilus harrisii]|uniref:Kinesin-like protein KIF15 n=1 Tax=Sarcophilus harrisii TaxID=9305 RepID=G3WJ93_SARHA|nr:kinesin-like protein KIF15 [Sarcophilus harrisii]
MAPGVKDSLRAVTPSQSNQVSNEGDVIKVFIRVRPPTEGPMLNDGEHSGLCLSVLTSNTLRLHSKPEPKIFTFDHVADMDTTQESIFSSVAKSIVESCMNGYNGTIFAYGQTGSGKTFTMMGPSESDNFTHNLRGVIPRSFEYLFFLIDREKEKAGSGKTFLCKCSFIEIYNEQIFDLLDSASSGLLLREHIKKGVCVVGAVEQVVTSAAEAYQVLSGGWRNRRVAATSMNRESSRSHAVFTITIESMEKNNDVVNIRSSQLNLVDLAGSERQKDTHTEGLRLKEAGNINRSLSCLGQVITALVDVGNGKQRHVCYRDSKLTFLLRDSLGGNAKTAIIANVHPGSKCFGETLSTLNFAQRAKLIKNKAVVNEDTQGNVSQLQAEVKKLKEQLAQLATAPRAVPDEENTNYMNYFREAMLFLKKYEHEKKSLLEKVAQLEDLSVKKEKFIQSNKMIVKFREDHIMRLEKLQKEARGSFLPKEQDELFHELREEIQTLREQIEQHPRIVKYAMENHSLREDNKRLRSLESVKKVQEMDAQTIEKLEKAFFEISDTAKNDKDHQGHLTSSSESSSSASEEKLRAQLLQTQGELNNSKQEYEEFKELTKKRQLELESELQSLRKANRSLESILEATKASKRQEVSQLNKIHTETLKIITTPTKAYQLRSRLVPRLSPEILNFTPLDTQNTNDFHNDIFNEPVPPEMNEQACEAISEELKVVQEQLSVLQTKLDEEESKNVKLQQHIDKVEHHAAQTQELFSSERTDWHKQQQEYLAQLSSLEQQLRDALSKNELMTSEIQDLRIVLQSADKELSSVKLECCSLRENKEKELSQLSQKHMDVQLQLDNVRLEHEKVLETKACLQDSYDNLQEVMKFETDQLSKELQDSQEANATLRTELSSLLELLETEKERNNKLISKLEEDKENNSKKFLEILDSVQQEKQKETAKCEQQTAKIEKLEQSLSVAENTIASLEKTKAADQEAVIDLMSQIQDLRASVSQKNGNIDMLTRELEDITSKYNSTLTEKDDCKADLKKQEQQIMDLKQSLDLRKLSDDIERDMLSEDLAHVTDQLNKLTEASKKHALLLQSTQEELAKKEAFIEELQEQLSQKVKELEQRKNAYSLKMRHLECVMDSASGFPQSPKTPPSFQTNLAKLLETQEQEIEDRRASTISLQHLVTKLNEERDVKNIEILRLKEQLHELEKTRLELQQLTETNQSLQSQLDDIKKQKKSSDQIYPDIHQLKKEQEREIVEERLAKNKAVEEMLKIKAELKEVKDVLSDKEVNWIKILEELERTRTLESKAFQEKEQLRSKLEEIYEEKDKILQETNMLRKQVEFLAEENGKLVGHTNPNQKIQYLVKLKKDNARLTEEAEKLRVENIFLKENRKFEICRDSGQIP